MGAMSVDEEEAVEPYELAPDFECALAYLCCCRPKLWARIGKELEVDAFEDEGAQLAIRMCKIISKERGQGPSSLSVVAQRLFRLKDDGKIDDDQIDDVTDLWDAAEDNGIPEEEDVINEMVPLLRRRVQQRLMRDAMDTYGKQGSMDTIAEDLKASERIGLSNNDLGLGMDDAFDAIEELAKLDRRPSGCIEMDQKTEGGSERGSLKCYVGGAGDGKSMMLIQEACQGLLDKFNVAYATLELNKARCFNRIIANLTNIPITAVASNKMDLAKKKMKELAPHLGMLRIAQFTPQVATIDDIRAWVERIEEETGETIHIVIVDYGDKLAAGEGKEQNGYLAMRDVFERYRVWMEDTGKWGVTASQAKRRDKNKKSIIDIDDLADSQHKARVVDIVITLNVGEDEDGEKVIKLFVAKNRNGEAGFTIGPLPVDFACARIVPVNRKYERVRRRRPEERRIEPKRTRDMWDDEEDDDDDFE